MNYKNIHDSIINRSKNRTVIPNVYYENHHIIPRCMDGLDDKTNMVYLTAKEHFLIHKLLHFMYPENTSLFNAYWMMSNAKNADNNERLYKVGAREYERNKETAIRLFGKECYLYHIYSDKVLIFYSGNQRDLWIEKNITNYPVSKLRSDKTCIGGEYLISNDKITQDEKNKIILKGNWSHMKVLQYNEDFRECLAEYRSVRDVMRKYKTANIKLVLDGKNQSAVGYRWIYKHELNIYGLEKLIKIKGFKRRKILNEEIYNSVFNLKYTDFLKKYPKWKHQYYPILKGEMKIGHKLKKFI